jgi:hypothetical protein
VALDLHELGTRPGECSCVELVGERLPAILVGNSFSSRVALETALTFGDRVPRLVLVDTAIADHEWSEHMRTYLRREAELLEAGDVDAAVELNLDRWALPHVRALLRPMQRRALELEVAGEGEPVWPDPRPLSALTMPVLIIVGERDTVDMNAIAQRIAREAPHARLEVDRERFTRASSNPTRSTGCCSSSSRRAPTCRSQRPDARPSFGSGRIGWPVADAPSGRGAGARRRPIGGRAAPASVKSSGNGLTARIHACEQPRSRPTCRRPCSLSREDRRAERDAGQVPRSAFDQRDRYAGDHAAEHSEGGQPATHPCASLLRCGRRRAGMRRAAGHRRVRRARCW